MNNPPHLRQNSQKFIQTYYFIDRRKTKETRTLVGLHAAVIG